MYSHIRITKNDSMQVTSSSGGYRQGGCEYS